MWGGGGGSEIKRELGRVLKEFKSTKNGRGSYDILILHFKLQ